MLFYSIHFAIATKKLSKSISWYNKKSIPSIKPNIRSIHFAFSRHSQNREADPAPLERSTSEFHAGEWGCVAENAGGNRGPSNGLQCERRSL
jgi:hypothetical protein